MTDTKRNSDLPQWVFVLLVAMIVVILGGIMLSGPGKEEPAAASPLTAAQHGGSLSGAPRYITVVKDNGAYASLSYVGQTIWGVKAVRIEQGTCIRINGATAKCASSGAYNVPLGYGTYVLERTK